MSLQFQIGARQQHGVQREALGCRRGLQIPVLLGVGLVAVLRLDARVVVGVEVEALLRLVVADQEASVTVEQDAPVRHLMSC
ncbi:hypothetical protein [Streptomyces yunnanensis]|uniref:hypothetical protein n=1 Tax=Streptomyces yunnanensis TaxID=156453 RepID=UPI003306A416